MPPLSPQPLVSVIVRTVGRPSLARTFERIAAQTHRPIEIALVDSLLTQEPKAAFRDIPVRHVRSVRLERAQAANAGLEAARGDAVLFLDDDDEIEPSHVADLCAALVDGRERAAFSQTRLVDAEGRTERIFGGPFDRMALFRSNYLAIHAVLFERSLVGDGCRFDESLAMFEDWDFWLQVSMRTAFAFTGKPTAIYHAARGQSGAGAGANLDRETILAHREKLMRKWEGARRALAIASGRA